MICVCYLQLVESTRRKMGEAKIEGSISGTIQTVDHSMSCFAFGHSLDSRKDHEPRWKSDWPVRSQTTEFKSMFTLALVQVAS